jgi:ribonucleoside-diphosphate reductase alpha chain
MHIARRFTSSATDVFSTIPFEQRTSRITHTDGKVVFEMTDAEIPASWSQLATDIVVSKYFRKAGVPQLDADGLPMLDDNGKVKTGPEKSVRQVVHRLAGCWTHWGKKFGYFDTDADASAFYDELAHMLLTQKAAPNSPQWFNTGLNFAYGMTGPAQGHWHVDPTTKTLQQTTDTYTHPQPHACFIQSVNDDLVNDGGIMDLWAREARLFKYGSGTGTNFSQLRGDNENLSGGGKSSGLMSFLKIGDRAAGAIKSGGTTRRAAKMVCLDMDHPDIEEFINWKVREEIKVAALVEGAKHLPKEQQELAKKLKLKLDYDFNGEAYATVSGQNSNNSVRVPNSFIRAVEADADWQLLRRTDGKVAKTLKANDLWNQVTFGAWRCADPGVQFDDTINEWHTCPAGGRINASNPCVTGDTLVATSTGYKRIIDLVGKSAEIINGNGEAAYVDRIFKTGTKDVYELTTRNGYCVKLTKDHRVKTQNRGDVKAEDLRSGDIFELRGSGFGPASISAGVARQLGQSFARDGLLFIGDQEVNRQLRAAWSNYVGGEPGYRRLMPDFFGLDEASQWAFLEGIFDFSGNDLIPSRDLIGESSSTDIQLVLLSFGIFSKRLGNGLTQIPSGSNGNWVACTRVEINRAVATLKRRGSLGSGSFSSVIERVEPLTDAFESLRAAGTEDVYDLTEPVSHHFVANGIVVHNCSEYMFLDNTACNLASINLMKFFDAESRVFDIAGFKHACRIWTMVLEISVLMAAYPSKEIAQLSYEYRTLGLGYANIGTMLMVAGIPYDSDTGRAICGAISAIMTGEAYAASAEMAKHLGTFPGYEKNRESMLRVIRNHRAAAYNNDHEYDGLSIKPVAIDAGKFNGKHPNTIGMLAAARESWDRALALGEVHGYRNAQVTCIAPTGTIGLLMDCDTTGVEPDFALVKFKKLSGGGYFKIANGSIEPALKNLGYTETQIKAILTHVLGTLTLVNAPHISMEVLKAKGFTDDDLAKIEDCLPSVFDLAFAFSPWTLGEATMLRLGFASSQWQDPSFNLLRALGFTKKQIREANDVICGSQTIEGAPHLKDAHLPVFDCANKCGRKGKRFIHHMGHINMMAAAQPFISGAISKTINMPNEVSIGDIDEAYRESWTKCLKAVALYRDGSKLSQPLNSSSDEAADEAEGDLQAVLASEPARDLTTTAAVAHVAPAAPAMIERIVERIVERPLRRRLPDTRRSLTHKFDIAGHEGYITVGLFEDHTPGEVFITMAKQGSTIGGLMDTIATLVSLNLQYGVPVEAIVRKFEHLRFEPSGMTRNSDIPFAKSPIDYLVRWMGMEFIPGYREANTPKRDFNTIEPTTPSLFGTPIEHIEGSAKQEVPDSTDAARYTASLAANGGANGHGPNGHNPNGGSYRNGKTPHGDTAILDAKLAKRSGMATTNEASVLSQQMATLMGDAPVCTCGSITVRNGSCYKCLNCGSSLGCS